MYQQLTGDVVCFDDETGEETWRDNNCYAGNGDDKDNPDSQNKPFKGPIPRGGWDVGTPYDSKEMGKDTVPLNPKWGDTTAGGTRDDKTFRMHGDSVRRPGEASEGCVICNKNTRRAISTNDGGGATFIVY